MFNAHVVLLVIACICFLFAAIGWPSPPEPPRYSLGWLGAFFAVLAFLVS